jgi:hypothetical protein
MLSAAKTSRKNRVNANNSCTEGESSGRAAEKPAAAPKATSKALLYTSVSTLLPWPSSKRADGRYRPEKAKNTPARSFSVTYSHKVVARTYR